MLIFVLKQKSQKEVSHKKYTLSVLLFHSSSLTFMDDLWGLKHGSCLAYKCVFIDHWLSVVTGCFRALYSLQTQCPTLLINCWMQLVIGYITLSNTPTLGLNMKSSPNIENVCFQFSSLYFLIPSTIFFVDPFYKFYSDGTLFLRMVISCAALFI